VTGQLHEVATSVAQLSEGMVLSRDVHARDGLLLIARGHVVDAALIAQLSNFEQFDGHPLSLFVKLKKEGNDAQHHARG
jgi:hypothetical protein